MMKIDIFTLFPEMFAGFLSNSIIMRAQRKGVVEVRLHNFRRFAKDKHHTVDDTPFGGGSGMVLKPEPIFECVEYLREKEGNFPLVYLTPKGKILKQDILRRWATLPRIAFLCGRYEGVDQRVVDYLVDEEISIGDFVLSGGEPAAIVVIDALIRLIPNALGKGESLKEESFNNSLLEYPHYTKPRKFRSYEVPDVLFSGNHKKIKEFREEKSIEITLKNRPDLLNKGELKWQT